MVSNRDTSRCRTSKKKEGPKTQGQDNAELCPSTQSLGESRVLSLSAGAAQTKIKTKRIFNDSPENLTPFSHAGNAWVQDSRRLIRWRSSVAHIKARKDLICSTKEKQRKKDAFPLTSRTLIYCRAKLRFPAFFFAANLHCFESWQDRTLIVLCGLHVVGVK